MDSKLTLKLDKKVIELAKVYAKEHGQSLSRLIENYLKALTKDSDSKEARKFEIAELVKSIPLDVDLPENYDYKEEYHKHLEKKYR
ncbi:MAG: hypothetical protein CMP59_00110 [Flavobacteriales bacterium]|nr:hypothetical protein [Flavobacteriales bacterium]|tara:strand:+ start:1986 stop:2243 length:258 start_codon:yes stop_codon:yes gene_type:complete